MQKENKVINVPLTGGIIGWATSSPHSALSNAIRKANKEGWAVRQVMPASSGNFFYSLLQFLVLLLTLFMLTFESGYYIILERGSGETSSAALNCPVCKVSLNEDEVYCSNCGHKQQHLTS